MICFDRLSRKGVKGEIEDAECSDKYKGFCKFFTLVENKFSN
jgi:hypothetical protein